MQVTLLKTMNISSYERGWPIFWDGEQWLYVDDKKPIDEKRQCFKCGEPPTPEGYDACLGYIKGAFSACCGHGKEKPYTAWEGIRGIPQQLGIILYNIWHRFL